jgi:tetratricopeptide (TPR) repeat protein
LSQLQRQGLIEPWHDRRITPGTEWAGAIDEQLEAADLIVLLVSADFLASDYCNDVEMNRAFERSEKGTARVIPVILEPCDWETSRFAKLQVLPKDGRPVVDWPTQDHAFNNAVTGLRRLIMALCGPAPVGAKLLQTAVRRHPLRWVSGAVAVAALIVGTILWSAGQRYLEQGTELLNVGRYADARAALEHAKFLNPISPAARCALKAVELDANGSDERQVEEANHALPNCAYLQLILGDHKYLDQDLPGALSDYQEAVKNEPRLAEAHFDIGRVFDLGGQPDSALPEYQRAVYLAPKIPRYHHNLADLYFKREDYKEAADEYGSMGQFPLAALELAKIYRLQGKLGEAQGREEDAVRWLRDPAIQNAEQQNAWAFSVSPISEVRLGPIVEKQCYADIELGLTSFLEGYDSKAATAIPAAFEKCSSRQEELRAILNWEIHKLGSEVPKFSERSEKFAQQFLTRNVA